MLPLIQKKIKINDKEYLVKVEFDYDECNMKVTANYGKDRLFIDVKMKNKNMDACILNKKAEKIIS